MYGTVGAAGFHVYTVYVQCNRPSHSERPGTMQGCHVPGFVGVGGEKFSGADTERSPKPNALMRERLCSSMKAGHVCCALYSQPRDAKLFVLQ